MKQMIIQSIYSFNKPIAYSKYSHLYIFDFVSIFIVNCPSSLTAPFSTLPPLDKFIAYNLIKSCIEQPLINNFVAIPIRR